MTDKRQFSIKDHRGNIFHLLDTSTDPTWYDVQAVEERRAPCGTLQSVVNHRDRSFEERRAQLQVQIGSDGVDL